MGQPDSKPRKTTRELLFDVSAVAHHYGRSKTETLSSVLASDAAPPAYSTSIPPAEPTVAVSEATAAIREQYAERLKKGNGQRSEYVTPFAKDHARIVHSPAFRRLQGKSQLIPSGEGEFFRTRLTHSQEVAEVGVRIARLINHNNWLRDWHLDYDLISCACLLHDIGHPPFGHSGEEVLNEEMAKWGGFEGNAQTLHLVAGLENRLGQGNTLSQVIEDPRGLNLTTGVLAAIVKYDQPIPTTPPKKGTRPKLRKGYYATEKGLVEKLKKSLGLPPKDNVLRTVECQVMDIADDIAYSAYDLEDTLEAGIIHPLDFFSVDDAMLDQIVARMRQTDRYKDVTPRQVLDALAGVFGPLLQDADFKYDLTAEDETVSVRHRRVYVGRTYHEAVLHARNPLIRRQYLETLIQDGIEAIRVQPADDRPPFLWTVKLAPDVRFRIECMKFFNYFKVINSRQLRVFHHRSKQIVRYLFKSLDEDEGGRLLHEYERSQLERLKDDAPRRMRLIADIIASLTDRDAVRLYFKLNPVGESSMFGYQ